MNFFLRGLKCLQENGPIYTINNITNKILHWFYQKLILNNYYDDLRNRVNNYQSLYPLSPRKTAIRLIWWNFKQIFKKHIGDNGYRLATISKKRTWRNQCTTSSQSTDIVTRYNTPDDYCLKNDALNIAFQIDGSVGDRLLAANYIAAFRDKYGKDHVRIDVIANGSKGEDIIFKQGYIIDNVYIKDPQKNTKLYCGNYDLYIRLERFPEIIQKHLSVLARFEPDLIDYVYRCEAFKAHHLRFFNHEKITAGQSAHFEIIKGKKRFQQADITDEFDLTEAFPYKLFIDESQEYLSNISLKQGAYITVHHGNDIYDASVSVKLWPLDYYDILLKLIKTRHPKIKIVQIATSEENCPSMENVDVNLVGKATMEQLKILLKNSLVHIDGESDMVHIRHALDGGTSIVMFGPTSEKFYGYSENVNIRGNGCETWCEWCVGNWRETCLRGIGGVPCMQSITPEMVFERFEDIIAKRGFFHE